MDDQAVESTGKRWLVLVIMFSNGFAQALGWMLFSGNPNVVREYYALGDSYKPVIDLLLNWGPIMYLPATLPVAWACRGTTENVWAVVLVGAWLCVAGLAVRLIPSIFNFPASPRALWFIHAGQILNALAGPMQGSTPSLIAATWFPPQERAFATATVNAVQMGGPAIGFLLALLVRNAEDFVLLMGAEAALALIAAVLWSATPKKPKRPPSVSQAVRRTADGPCQVPSQRRCFSLGALLLSGSFIVGFFQVWSVALPTSLNGVLSAPLLKWLAFITGLGSMVGNFGAGPAVEKLGMQTRLRKPIVWSIIVQIVCYSGFIVVLPDSPLRLWSSSRPPAAVLLVLLVCASAAEGVMSPMIYELGAELTFPYKESLSGAIYSWLLNAFGLLFLVVCPYVSGAYSSISMLLASLLGLQMMWLVKEEYPRRAVDDSPGFLTQEDGAE